MVRAVIRKLVGRARRLGAARQSGFTLVETLIAVAIMAAIIAVVPGGLVTARATINQSEGWLRARLVAEAALSGDLGGTDLVPGTRQGEISGRSWRAVVEEDKTLTDAAAEAPWMVLRVTVTVDASAGRTLTVETMRVGRR